MIYFDACYVAKWYLSEPDSPQVRQTATQAGCVGSCHLVRAEFASILHRYLRDGALSPTEVTQLMTQFDLDIQAGQWALFPLSDKLVHDATAAIQSLPAGLLIRAGDALHLACAVEHGFKEIYSSDRHMLAAAPHFGLNGIKL
jgi:predicted nucleic acid-binding protein